ncbi:MAG: hypothetical protein HY520_00030 [Candidatus Aenigmarchaeota archaeon]|nr:hypothetical protein [Candidatus Aenigmarchaeota archaeon]
MGDTHQPACQLCTGAIQEFQCMECLAAALPIPPPLRHRFGRFQRVLRFYYDAFGRAAGTCASCDQAAPLLCKGCYHDLVRQWQDGAGMSPLLEGGR